MKDLRIRRTLGVGAAYAFAGMLVVLAALASSGPDGILIAAAFATLVVAGTVLVVVGPDGLGMALLGLSFFMAPYFRALVIVPGTAISAVDPILALGSLLLLPRIARGRPRISSLYVGSAASFILIGFTSALATPVPAATLIEVSQWLYLAVMLPVAFMALDLSNREITRFACLYIAGQLLSSAVAFAVGPDPVNQRYQGLAAHPNYFADGAMMSAALLLYLYHHPAGRRTHWRLTWWIVMWVCLVGLYVSGSRGALLGLAAVFVLVPLVERSTLPTFLGTLAVAVGSILVQPLVQQAGEGTTLARLTGQDRTGTMTTDFRLSEWHEALDRIAQSPFLGSGLSLEVQSFHNNYLEIAAGIGIFGLAAYLVMLWSLTRGLFGPSVERRLLYPMVAFAVFGLTEPGFQDRSNWLPMFLGIAVFHGFRTAARGQDAEPAPTPSVPGPERSASRTGR